MMEENKGTYAYPNGIYYIFVFILKIDNERVRYSLIVVYDRRKYEVQSQPF